MAESKSYSNTTYQSVSPEVTEMGEDYMSPRPKMELGSHPPMAEKRAWWKTAFWQIFALAWLVPVIALLYLNFTNYVIGASAWCPGEDDCWLNAFNLVSAVPQERMRKFDNEDHNLLGGLQFVAKGLEVWFGIVAAALIYLVTMEQAGKKEGLPIGYLTRPMEFGDVVGLFDGLFWKTGPTPLGVKGRGEKRLGWRVWYLIALSVFLCILINLMGPATAVLVIPALSWVTTPQIGHRTFLHLNAGNPPTTTSEGWFWWGAGCVNSYPEFISQNYTCTYWNSGTSLDTWVDSSLSIQNNIGFTSQSGLTFSVNFTREAKTTNSVEQLKKLAEDKNIFTDITYWAPSRQIISNLSVDLLAVDYLSRGYLGSNISELLKSNIYYPDPIHTYNEYNKSLELQIRRNGPIAGAVMNKWVTYNDYDVWTVDVDANRHIRCYNDYDLRAAPLQEFTQSGTYTRCIRLGTGWSKTNKKASFYAEGAYDPVAKEQGPGVTVELISSDRAAYLPNGKVPDWLPKACLSGGSSKLNQTNCDYKRLFTADPNSELFNRTENVNTIEISLQSGKSSTMLVVDFVAFLAFTNYTLDPFFFSNPTSLVQNEDLPPKGTSFNIDPAWLLAGWSVGDGGTVLSNRTTTNLLLDVMTRLLANPDQGVYLGYEDSDFKIDYLSFLPVMHSLSLIDHSTTMAPYPNDKDHPLLQRDGRMYVWAYGLGSRTSYLGVAVAILGCVVVVWQFILGFLDRRRYRSPTQLLVAALEHCPRGEFDGKGHDELAMARVRFHIKDDNNHTGKFSFFEPEPGQQ